MSTKERIALFWKWFAENHYAYSFLKEVSAEEANRLNKVREDKLYPIDSCIECRIDTNEAGSHHTLLLNDYTDKPLSRKVKQMILYAPVLPDWTFSHVSDQIGLHQSTNSPRKLFIDLSGLMDIYMDVIPMPSTEKPKGVMLIIYHDEGRQKPDLRHVEEVLLEFVEEYGFNHYVRGLELAAPGQPRPEKAVLFPSINDWMALIFPISPPP